MVDNCTDQTAIVFVTRKWAPAMGGMETYCHRLTETLSTSYDVDTIALPGEKDGSPPSIGRLLLFPCKILKRWFERDCVPDVLHIADMALWPVGLIAPHRTRIVLSAHGTDVSYPRRGGFKGHIYGAYLKLGAHLLKRAHVIANSRATQDALIENNWQDISVIPLATDMRFRTLPKLKKRTILFAGRLVTRKGLLWFVQNVLGLLPPDMQIEVAGTIWDKSEEAALDHPKVTFLGQLDPEDLAEAYASSLCVILPNIEQENGEFEGFGLIACEAAAAGGVVLAANIEGLKEAVIDGETGFQVPAKDPESWAEEITKVANWSDDERSSILQAFSNRCREYYSWSRVAKETSERYQLS